MNEWRDKLNHFSAGLKRKADQDEAERNQLHTCSLFFKNVSYNSQDSVVLI